MSHTLLFGSTTVRTPHVEHAHNDQASYNHLLRAVNVSSNNYGTRNYNRVRNFLDYADFRINAL